MFTEFIFSKSWDFQAFVTATSVQRRYHYRPDQLPYLDDETITRLAEKILLNRL